MAGYANGEAMRLLCLYLLALFLPITTMPADEKDPKKKDDSKKPEEEKEIEEITSVTEHSTTIRGKKFNYVATAGTIRLDEDELKAKASVFFVAYTRKTDNPKKDNQVRPVSFCFNGGPGSSAVWLHLGGLGPPPPAPFR